METVIEIRRHRGGWQCFEAPGVESYYTGANAKAYAISYAKGRPTMRRGEIRILDSAGEVEDVIPFDNKVQKFWFKSPARGKTQ